MSYKFMPFVVKTVPMNMSVDVETSTDISIVFNTDINPDSLQNNIVVWAVGSESKIDGAVFYKDRVATFKPAQPLSPGTTYTVTVVGDANLEDGHHQGVLSILGYPMAGMYTFTFTTASVDVLPAPTLLSPANFTVIGIDQVRFSWLSVPGAEFYDVQLAASPDMEPLLWQTTTTETAVVPDYSFQAGNYFWRVRGLKEGEPGVWSAVYSFAAAEEQPEDGEDPESPGDRVDDMVVVVPEALTDVDPAADKLVLKLPSGIRPEDIKIRLVGKSLAGNPLEDHGLVPVSVTVDESNSMFTLVTVALCEKEG